MIRRTVLFILLWLALNGSASATGRLPTRDNPLIADLPAKRVLIYTEVNGHYLTESNPHWGVVFVGGKLAEKGILWAYVEPTAFYDALLKIGARPGNNLTSKSYGEFVKGDHLQVTATWPGLDKELSLAEIIGDEAGKGFAIRFGGNRKAAAEEHTGCITCLEGCWIAITSNDRYPFVSPVRRFFSPNSRFQGRSGVLPGPGKPVILIYRLNP